MLFADRLASLRGVVQLHHDATPNLPLTLVFCPFTVCVFTRSTLHCCAAIWHTHIAPLFPVLLVTTQLTRILARASTFDVCLHRLTHNTCVQV